TLPVVARPAAGQDKLAWLQALQAQNTASREHEHLTLAEIQRCAKLEGGTLFDSIIVFENYPVDETLQSAQAHTDQGPRFRVRQVREETSYPMTLSVSLGQSLTIEYAWPGRCFSVGQVEALAGQMEALLQSLADPACRVLGQARMVGDGEVVALAQEGMGAALHPDAQAFQPVHRRIA